MSTLNPLFEGTPIFRGDFNVAFDHGLDKSNPAKITLTRPTRASLKFARLIHAQGLVDVWREQNPTIRDYTHFSSPHQSYARIDHILMSMHHPNVANK